MLEDETRRAIVALLRDGERSAGEISSALGRCPPSVSHHLSRLLQAGLLTCRQEGVHRFYALDLARTVEAWERALLAPAGRTRVAAT